MSIGPLLSRGVQRSLDVRNDPGNIPTVAEDPCELWVVLDESILRRAVRNASIVAAQLDPFGGDGEAERVLVGS